MFGSDPLQSGWCQGREKPVVCRWRQPTFVSALHGAVLLQTRPVQGERVWAPPLKSLLAQTELQSGPSGLKVLCS